MQFQALHRYCIRTLLLIVLSLSLLPWGCSHKETSTDDAEALFADAEEAFKDERYLVAIEKYRDLKNRFPYSARATDSELRIADAYFEQESYLEAESSYEVFKELHPTHSKIEYVQYRIGLSYFYQIPSHSSRDLTAAHRAIEAFGVLLDKYPTSEFVPKAQQHVIEARKKLAEYESYVADFYFQRKHYLSASYRYAALLKDFSKLGYDEEALFRLGECYYHTRMFGNAKDALLRLLNEYPDSVFKAQSEARLNEIKPRN